MASARTNGDRLYNLVGCGDFLGMNRQRVNQLITGERFDVTLIPVYGKGRKRVGWVVSESDLVKFKSARAHMVKKHRSRKDVTAMRKP